MSYRPKGKNVDSIDPYNSEALGICDLTGFIHKRKDLLRQMQWRGNRLVWTGFLVGRNYLDKPNEQLRPPPLKPDPVPVKMPRLPQGTLITWEYITSPVWEQTTYTYWENWGTYSDGYPAISPSARLANLQAGGYPEYPPLNIGYYPPLLDALPEDQRLIALQTFRWVD